MKSFIYVVTFLLFSMVLSAQDTTATNYKNQIGFDVLPIISGLTVDGEDIFNNYEFLYRRKLNDKNWLQINLVITPYDYTSIQNYYGINLVDSTNIVNNLDYTTSIQTQFSFLRTFLKRKHIELAYGGILGLQYARASVNTYQYDFTNTWNPALPSPIFTNYDRPNYFQLSLGPSLSMEIPITKRISILTNASILFQADIGKWTYYDEYRNPINESTYSGLVIDYIPLRDVAIMYSF